MDQALSLPWLLLATPQLMDVNFKKSVVLMVEHSEKGSMGFVLNRPTHTALSDLVTVPNLKIPGNVPAWYGGPVEKGTGIVLHDCTKTDERLDSLPVSLSLSSSETALADLVLHSQTRQAALAAAQSGGGVAAGKEGLYPYRFLIGYSGWGMGQVLSELHAGAWIQTRATWRLLFNTDWQVLWDEAFGMIGTSPRALVPTVHQYLH